MNLNLKLSILTAILALGTACVPELAPPQPPPEPTQPPTLSPTTTPSPSETPVATASPTVSPTASATPSPTPTSSATPTATPTPTAIPTPTATVDPNLDFDGDGFTTLEGDCAPRDPDIYPGAFDMPFDGQDGNCNGVQDRITQILGSTLNEGGDARYARMDQVLDVEVASDGTIYASDGQLCSIRQIKDGLITTLIGNGACKITGDGEHMSQAGVSRVQAMAIDERRERLYYITVGEIWYLDLQTKIVHHFAGNRDSYDVIEAIEGIPPDEVYFDGSTLAIDDRWGTLYFVSNHALFQLETDPQYYDRLQLLMGSPGKAGDPSEGVAQDSLMMHASDLRFDLERDTFYLNLRSTDLTNTHGYIAKLTDDTLAFLAGQDDECYRDYRNQSGDMSHPDTQETIEGLESDEIMFCYLKGLECIDEICFASDSYHLYQLDLSSNVINRIASEAEYKPPGYVHGNIKSFDENFLDELAIASVGKMAYDATTNSLIWAESYNQLIRRMRLSDRYVHHVGGYGPIGHYSDGVHQPLIGLIKQILPDPAASDENGLYLSDARYSAVLHHQNKNLNAIAGRVGILSTYESDGPATDTPLYSPEFITMADDGSLYVYTFDLQIFRVKDGLIHAVAGTPAGVEGQEIGEALSVALEWPQPMKFNDSTGQILILQTDFSDRIIALRVDEYGMGTIESFINFPTSIESHGMAIESGAISEFEIAGDDLYLLTSRPPTLMKYNGTEIEVLVSAPETNSDTTHLQPETHTLRGLTLADDGTLYFSDLDYDILYQYRPQTDEIIALKSQVKGYIEATEVSGASIPQGEPTAGYDGCIYINNIDTQSVYRIDW